MATRGKFITFEGCDGCGKSTQLKLFNEYLTREGVAHIFTREPGGGKISEAIREILLNGKNSEMTDECEALLYAAARAQHLSDRVEPALAEGKLVICDRYVDSSFAYQAYARGLGREFIGKINAFALEKYLPDVTILSTLRPRRRFCVSTARTRTTVWNKQEWSFINGYTTVIKRLRRKSRIELFA